MCGLVGFASKKISSDESARNQAELMAQTLYSRGPDDLGVWASSSLGVGLGHRRLAIQDLSESGHQPMLSASKRYIIVFNGEIYNHLELRKEIDHNLNEYVNWKGHSDTETLLVCIELFGIKETLKKCVGMFVFAVVDRFENNLYLAKDRMGEKPLYYGWQNNTFLFGSELKSLKAHPEFKGDIDRNSIALQFRHNYIPTPYSIYKGIYKLIPGTYAKLNLKYETWTVGQELDIEYYWKLENVIKNSKYSSCDVSYEDKVNKLEKLLLSSVKGQMISDVPIGAFLSGGIDSSTIVALMQSLSKKPVKTFSIGFHEDRYNEAVYAKEIAKHLGTEHTEVYVSSQNAIDIVPSLHSIYDEPFSDSSQIPTFLISKITKEHVSVSLSGDAGDELFAGYDRYFFSNKIWRILSKIPPAFRSILARSIRMFPIDILNNFGDVYNNITLPKYRLARAGDKAYKLSELLNVSSANELYYNLISHWKDPAEIVPGSSEPETILTNINCDISFDDFEHHMMYIDSLSYLPDDILVKVDRAAMAVSLETRIPFLDHRVIEFAWNLPLEMKIKNGVSKSILRDVLYKYVPKNLIDRPKMGFGIPMDKWLRGPLREWAETLLNESRITSEGYLNPLPVRKKWDEFIKGDQSYSYCLWDVLMFQSWLENTK